MKILQGIKSWWMAYLKKLGDANQKEFGNKRLSCCDMKEEK